LDSTHVVGASTARIAARLVSMTCRSRAASHADLTKVEVESRVQPARSDVAGEPLRRGHPCLGDQHAVAVVGVEHLAPLLVDRQDLVAVPVRVVDALGRLQDVLDLVAQVRQFRVLGETVCDVDPEAVSTPVEPEPQH
jgi:hypothetical protein